MSSFIIDELHGSGGLNITQKGLTGNRIARCNWQDWPQVVRDLMGTIIIFNGYSLLIGRGTWPGIPALKVDTVTIEGMGQMLNSSWGFGPVYKYAKVMIDYKVPEEEEEEDENGNPGAYLVESLDYSVEIAVVPVKAVDKADKKKLSEKPDEALDRAKQQYDNYGNPMPAVPAPPADPETKAKMLKRHIRIPTITYTVTIPKSRILPADKIRDAVGKVNTKRIFGGPPGTVLFDGPNAERESAFLGERTWRIKYAFIYNRNGWNNVLHPDTLKWVPALAAGSDNAPYERTDLRKIFPLPYVVRN